MIVDNGMEIPADGFLVKSSELTADESAMTGDSLIKLKITLPFKYNLLNIHLR